MTPQKAAVSIDEEGTVDVVFLDAASNVCCAVAVETNGDVTAAVLNESGEATDAVKLTSVESHEIH